MVLPELSECQLYIQGYSKHLWKKDLRIEFFEVGNDLLVHGLEQRSCVRGQELHSYETIPPVSRPPTLEGGQEHCP